LPCEEPCPHGMAMARARGSTAPGRRAAVPATLGS
jgi:hypothetical protein